MSSFNNEGSGPGDESDSGVGDSELGRGAFSWSLLSAFAIAREFSIFSFRGNARWIRVDIPAANPITDVANKIQTRDVGCFRDGGGDFALEDRGLGGVITADMQRAGRF